MTRAARHSLEVQAFRLSRGKPIPALKGLCAGVLFGVSFRAPAKNLLAVRGPLSLLYFSSSYFLSASRLNIASERSKIPAASFFLPIFSQRITRLFRTIPTKGLSGFIFISLMGREHYKNDSASRYWP